MVTGNEHKTPVGAVETQRQVWVVGVEDFMRRFLPGRSNAKSIFALAQLNGIVKYACHKVNTWVDCLLRAATLRGINFGTVSHERCNCDHFPTRTPIPHRQPLTIVMMSITPVSFLVLAATCSSVAGLLQHLGAKANSFHPSTPRSFYGLTKNKVREMN